MGEMSAHLGGTGGRMRGPWAATLFRMDGEGGEAAPPGEYRIEELARAAGMPVRTVRYYRERRLLPPPRRAGRVTLYSAAHLTRLKVIGRLLERGHTLDTVAELLAAWEQGHDVAELIGLERAMTAPWSDEVPASMTLAELTELFDGQVTAEDLAEAIDLGYIRIDGDTVTHSSRRLLEASASLVREGIPLSAVLVAARQVQHGLDELAALFVGLVVDHLLTGPLTSAEMSRVAEIIERIRPLARIDIDVEFGRAMDRMVRRSLGRVLSDVASTPDLDGGPDLRE